MPVLLNSIKHAAHWLLLEHPEPSAGAGHRRFAGPYCGHQSRHATAGHSCLQAGDSACGHVSEQLLQGCWTYDYTVPHPPLAPVGPRPETLCR